MRNKIGFLLQAAGILSLLALVIYGCKKDKVVTANKEVAFFSTGAASATYRISTPTTIYKIPVGLTKIPAGSRTVQVSVVSPSGAVAGTHYTLNKTSFTFTPDHIMDTIIVTGKQSLYLTGRKDTLKFSFTNTEDGIPTLSNTFTLAVRGPCLEDDITAAGFNADLAGNYTKTYENGSYGPYTSSITAAAGVSTTSAKATINNIYESAISAEAIFDWSTPGTYKVTVAPQATQYTSGGLPLFVRSTPATTSTFLYCQQTLTLYLDIYTSARTVDSWVMTMAR